MSVLSGLAITAVSELVIPTIKNVLLRPETPVDNEQADKVAEIVANELVPVVVHNTNNEPWYQSRVTIGALVSSAAGIAGLFGIAISPEDSELMIGVGVAAGTAIGGLVTLYGRWVAKKPLGR